MFSYLLSFKKSLKSLGPGIISGAADDDPSAIATFSQAGAQFGFGLLWTPAFLYPMLIVIQEMCARIGLITGGGLATAYPEEIPPKDYCLSDCSSLNCCKYSNHWSRHWCHFSVRKSYIASNSNGFCYCFFCSICNCC